MDIPFWNCWVTWVGFGAITHPNRPIYEGKDKKRPPSPTKLATISNTMQRSKQSDCEEPLAANLSCIVENFGISDVEQNCQHADSMVFGSIDDFLHFFRPHRNHVHDFIACMGDEPYESSACQVDMGHEFHWKQINSKPNHAASSSSDPSQMSGLTGIAFQSRVSAPHANGTLYPKQSKIKRIRQSNTKLSAERRLERRRDQNREAQRRFRVKRLLLLSRTFQMHGV